MIISQKVFKLKSTNQKIKETATQASPTLKKKKNIKFIPFVYIRIN